MAEIFQFSCFCFGQCTWSAAGWWVSGFCLSTSIMLPQKYHTIPYVPYYHETCVPYITHHYTISTKLHYIVCTIYNNFPATKILHCDHTKPSMLRYMQCHIYLKIDYICAHKYNALACRSLGCHFLDHRMLFNSILFHVNQPWLLTNAFIGQAFSPQIQYLSKSTKITTNTAV